MTWMQPRRTSSFGDERMHLLTVEHDGAFGHFAALGATGDWRSLQRGGLAGAIGAQERDDLALAAPQATRP